MDNPRFQNPGTSHSTSHVAMKFCFGGSEPCCKSFDFLEAGEPCLHPLLLSKEQTGRAEYDSIAVSLWKN